MSKAKIFSITAKEIARENLSERNIDVKASNSLDYNINNTSYWNGLYIFGIFGELGFRIKDSSSPFKMYCVSSHFWTWQIL